MNSESPHSRACGALRHEHGSYCHSNCPTCHGVALESQPPTTPEPSETEVEALANAMFEARYPEGFWLDGHSSPPEASDEDVARAAIKWVRSHAPTTPERADLREQIESLRVAMLGTEDGGFLDPDDEIPVGEMFRLASEWFALVTPPTPADRARDWERGIRDWVEHRLVYDAWSYGRRDHPGEGPTNPHSGEVFRRIDILREAPEWWDSPYPVEQDSILRALASEQPTEEEEP